MTFSEVHEADLPRVASRIIDVCNEADVRLILLKGDLGAGKTTLVKALASLLGSTDAPSSPTFALINEYKTEDRGRLVHIDLYRLSSLEEARQIGIEDYLYSDSWCFIEWPDLVMPLIGPPYAEITIEEEDHASRNIRILIHSSLPTHE